MRRSIVTVAAVAVSVGVVLWNASTKAADGLARSRDREKTKEAEREKVWARITWGREGLVRVTAKAFKVEWYGIWACRLPSVQEHTPHGMHWIDVFVTPGGTNAMMTGTGTYPEGTVILKQKYSDEKATKTEFFTGMLKREQGFNPDAGDWEFFMLDAPGNMVTARGRIESCVECHQKYAATDFVARDYLKQSAK